jgi:hypothetical protein
LEEKPSAPYIQATTSERKTGNHKKKLKINLIQKVHFLALPLAK